ncbi:MAG: manganese efflux pump MntP family protein [Bacillota bacterium]|nr:manganese efflux pump MntP family protein [Bacillota bacterium]
MRLFELILLAVGLSMDAMAVALCKGLAKKKPDPRQGMVLALYFGGFQAVMPLIGYFLGRQFKQHITAFDHWIAFLLLLLIGGKMIYGFVRGASCDLDQEARCSFKELLTLAVATSIDALAVGITFAFLQVSIVPAVLLIGVTTWGLSLAGYLLGNRLGSRFGSYAELGGGIVLVLIGSKILLEHLEIISF